MLEAETLSDTMIPKDEAVESEQVKALAKKPTTKGGNDAKSNVKSTAKMENKIDFKKKKYESDDDEDEDDEDSVCLYNLRPHFCADSLIGNILTFQ